MTCYREFDLSAADNPNSLSCVDAVWSKTQFYGRSTMVTLGTMTTTDALTYPAEQTVDETTILKWASFANMSK